MQTTLAQEDPKRIACPRCKAPVGEWCQVKAGGGHVVTDPGNIHRKRARAAHRFRMAGRPPAGQLSLFEGAR